MSATSTVAGGLGQAASDAPMLGSLRACLAAVFVAAVFAIVHPYVGIVADAALYIGRSVANLDPEGVGRDIAFANDGQSRFSVFSHLSDPLVATLGPSRAGLVIALAASAAVLAGLAALAGALTGDRRCRVAIVLAAILLPSTYGAGAFRFAEASAVPRPFAEAAVLAAVAALLGGRPLRAAPFLLAALAIHPLMAMAGIGVAAVLAAWRRRPSRTLVMVSLLAVPTACGAALAILGAAGLGRFAVRVDPEWLAMLTQRSAYLFPTMWEPDSWTAPLVDVTTIATLWPRVPDRHRRVLVAVAISAALQLAASVLLGDTMHVLLAIQVQGWRALWLVGLVGSCCLPLVATRLWREGPQARIALALIGLAALCPFGPAATAVFCAAALVLQRPSIVVPVTEKHAAWLLYGAAAIVAVRAATAATDWAALVATEPKGVALGLLAALRADLLVPPAGLALSLWLLGDASVSRPAKAGVAGLALLTAATVALAATNWDQRSAADALFARQDSFPPASVPGARSSEVMVFGGLSEAWFALGRPQYLSAQQASGIVFSRPLAMEWQRRADALRGLDLAARDPLHPDDRVTITAAKLAAFCGRDDAPAALVIPDRLDEAAPVLPEAVHWPAAPPRPFLAEATPARWRTVRGWIVAPCATAPAPRPALAKSATR